MIEHQTVYPPLTEQEFADGCGFTYRGITLNEDEHGMYVYAYGHRDKARFAAAVSDFDLDMGADCPPYEAEHVRHVWAVTLAPADSFEGWYVTWAEWASDHPQRFPMSVVNR